MPRLVELLRAKTTARVKPSSSITLGALTLIVTFPLSSARRKSATLTGVALGPIALRKVSIAEVVPEITPEIVFWVELEVVEPLEIPPLEIPVEGVEGVEILGVDGKDGTEVEGLEVVNDGLEIVLTFGRIGIAL